MPTQNVFVGIVAENASGSSPPVGLHVRRVRESNEPKPNLYVLAVGVKDYNDRSIRGSNPIQFADKDAVDFANMMDGQKGKFYNDVKKNVLLNDAASRNAILTGLVSLKKSSTNKDVAMIFISGHGVTRDGISYDYLPVEADIMNPEVTYLHDYELTNFIKQIPAKIVVFVDTCHSGNFFQSSVIKAVDSDYLKSWAVELARSSSFIAVYTSSTGKELSIEKEEFEHGAFTEAILEAFAGKAVNDKGGITLARLNDYITDRARELTAGLQHPSYIAPNANTNPVIGAGR